MAAQHEVNVGALIRAQFEPAANDNEQAEERELRRLTGELRKRNANRYPMSGAAIGNGISPGRSLGWATRQ